MDEGGNSLAKLKQYPAIDIAKYVAAMLVVAIHTFPFVDFSPAFNLFFISTIGRLAVPFFFVCSSFFLFRKVNQVHLRSIQAKEIVKKWFVRIGVLYLIWTVIYLPYTIWNYAQAGFSLSGLLGWIRDFFLNGSYYHLWFLPALMLGMAIVWWLYTKKGVIFTLEVSLILYFIGYLINIFGPIWESLPYISIVYGFFVKMIVTARDGFFFAPLFIGIGLMCSQMRRPTLKACSIGFAASFIGLILEVCAYSALGVLNDQSSMFLMLIPALYFFMNMMLQIKIPKKAVYVKMRQESTLIYVSHILFARLLLLVIPEYHLVVYLVTLALAQFFASTVLRLSDKYPWLNWLM